MNKLYMGIDAGGISIKGIIIDDYNNILASSYLYANGDPVDATLRVVKSMRDKIDLDKYQVVSVGVTGSAKKLIGTMLNANVIKNEINASATGVVNVYPDARTVIEIGGYDSKIILLDNGVITDYAISTSCMCGGGAFLDSMAEQLNMTLDTATSAIEYRDSEIDISSRCTVFAQKDLIGMIQSGYKKESVLLGLCQSVVRSYMNGIAKGKKVQLPVVFIGGVSKNSLVVRMFEKILGEKIIVGKNSHLMGAFGIAVMARNSKNERIFDFNIDHYNVETMIDRCANCPKKCEIVTIYRNNRLVDYWGNKCDNGDVKLAVNN